MKRFEEVLSMRTRHISVVLEDIFQPHNASAVLRSCDCFGVQDVHIIENRNRYEVNPDVALGSSKWLTLHRYNASEDNTLEAYSHLRAKGFKIVATTPHDGAVSLPELDITGKTALVFGTELTGLTKTAIDQADDWMTIPMFGFTESFNISVSVAITLYELVMRLRKSETAWELTPEEKEEILLEWMKNTIKQPEKLIRQFQKK
ncbi:MAG: RNA methyltransferase [Bacteroidales bacterium]